MTDFTRTVGITAVATLLSFPSFSEATERDAGEGRFPSLRKEMVASQIAARGIKNARVLSAMRAVERHRFVPDRFRNQAYGDHPLSIGYDQTISQPYIVALMTEVIDPDTAMKVLEIGTGSAYQAAVLAELCDTVFTIEINRPLAERARKTLAETGYGNVKVKTGDGYRGWKEHAPFDAIIVTCAPTHVPRPLVEQLKNNGKMVIPVGESGDQKLILLLKKEGKMVEEAIIPVRFVPMIDEKGQTY
ncbi:MAG: protein-L-isoaspartate(D-aspartate) O-methyltransferase [Chitinispirillaceae bacterium]|nr:protein-L-isoaspartate(D-aspartate) O-methyltransferase [Chitinispirillaceae bacterium]